jgi:hypothetical protein
MWINFWLMYKSFIGLCNWSPVVMFNNQNLSWHELDRYGNPLLVIKLPSRCELSGQSIIALPASVLTVYSQDLSCFEITVLLTEVSSLNLSRSVFFYSLSASFPKKQLHHTEWFCIMVISSREDVTMRGI